MIRNWRSLGILLAAAAALAGCESGRIKEQTVDLHMTKGLERAKEYIEHYAKGEPIGSEAAAFSGVVEEVRATDPAKAEVLEKGFADLLKAKGDLKPKAQALLKKL
jgi:hypothetical protein